MKKTHYPKIFINYHFMASYFFFPFAFVRFWVCLHHKHRTNAKMAKYSFLRKGTKSCTISKCDIKITEHIKEKNWNLHKFLLEAKCFFLLCHCWQYWLCMTFKWMFATVLRLQVRLLIPMSWRNFFFFRISSFNCLFFDLYCFTFWFFMKLLKIEWFMTYSRCMFL